LKNPDVHQRSNQSDRNGEDPLWPGVPTVRANVSGLVHGEAGCTSRDGDIKHWNDRYRVEAGSWTSIFDMKAFYAQCDINKANKRIAELQREIEDQEKIKREAKKLVTKYKKHDVDACARVAHRPKQSEERKIVARNFTSAWVRSIRKAVGAESYGQLALLVKGKGSNSANWYRWENQQATITPTKLHAVLKHRITDGEFKGKTLEDIQVIPSHSDLLTLVSLL